RAGEFPGRGRIGNGRGGGRGLQDHPVGSEGEGDPGEYFWRDRQVRPDRRGPGDGGDGDRLQGAGGGAPGGDQRREGAGDFEGGAVAAADIDPGDGFDGCGAEGDGGGGLENSRPLKLRV